MPAGDIAASGGSARARRRAGILTKTPVELASELVSVGTGAGLAAVRICDVAPFADTRKDLEHRKAAGLHAGMGFTYLRPARSSDPASALPDARTLVVGARSYDDGRLTADYGTADEEGLFGLVARSARGDQYAPLKAALGAVARTLKAHGFRARVLADDNALVDRAAAYRAGIGWWGKNSLILLPRLGSYYVLGSVLTDAPLPTDDGPEENHCGSCFRCAPACPTGAIVAPGVIDANRCLAWLLEAPGMIPRELRVAVGSRVYGCDACQEACPPNRTVALRRRRVASGATDFAVGAPGPAAPSSDGGHVDLIGMITDDDASLLERFGHFYLAGRDVDLLRRNALVALANSTAARLPRNRVAVSRALRAGLRSDNSVVRATAVWSCARLGRADLVAGERVDSDVDPLVRAELAAYENES